MQYKITKQYAKDKEKPLAEFNDLNDAMLFITAKLSDDEIKNLKLIYRLFENDLLFSEFNKEKINTPLERAQYAQGDIDLPQRFADPFRVFIQNLNNENIILAKFCYIEDARIFVTAKFAADTSGEKNNEIYLIFNGKQFIDKINKDRFDRQQTQSQATQGTQQKTSFRPTPFATTLRLGPPKWVVDDEDDDGKNNED